MIQSKNGFRRAIRIVSGSKRRVHILLMNLVGALPFLRGLSQLLVRIVFIQAEMEHHLSI